jgi:type I restriction enzyme S subunit
MNVVSVTTLQELVESGVVQLTRGKIISKRDIAACPGSFPIYSSAKDNDGKFGEYGKFLFDEELITWSVDGGGRLFHRPKHKFSVTNVGGVLRIRDTSILDYRYLYFALTLRHSEINFDWVRKAHPSVIKKLYQDIPLPPLAEQQRIVGILDEAFAGLATAKANAETNLQNARALFESHLQSVFSQRGEGWVEKPFSELCDIKHGFAFKGEFFSNKGDYVVLTPGNYYESGGYRDRGDKQKYYTGDIPPDYIMEVGEMLVAMTEQAAGLLGSPLLVPESDKFLHNQRLGLVTAKPGVPWTNEFFFHVFNTAAVRKAIHASASGVKVRHTSPSKIGEVVVSFPTSIKEQKAIVAVLEKLLSETQRLTAIYTRKLAALEELKKALLHQAFSGEL